MVPGRRFTVLRQSDGHFLIEDLHTGEQARVDALDRVGDQIQHWLDAPVAATPTARAPILPPRQRPERN